MVSTSSRRTMQGPSFACSGMVCWNSFVTSRWLFPSDELASACGSIWRKRTFPRITRATSLASPLASVVLPLPGGPVSNKIPCEGTSSNEKLLADYHREYALRDQSLLGCGVHLDTPPRVGVVVMRQA